MLITLTDLPLQLFDLLVEGGDICLHVVHRDVLTLRLLQLSREDAVLALQTRNLLRNTGEIKQCQMGWIILYKPD